MRDGLLLAAAAAGRHRIEIALSLLSASLYQHYTYAFLRPPFPRLDTRLFFPTAMVK